MAATIFGACAQTGKTSRTKTRAHGKTQEVSSVAMRRGACFGRCPEYTLTIRRDGTVIYNGTRNAPSLGTFEKNIGTEEAAKLMTEISNYRVDTLQRTYRANIADLPGLSYVFIVGGKEQAVGNANFGPEFLTDLAAKIDSYGKVDGSWKKTAEAPPAE